jgi:hypothetical protein
MLKLAVLYVKVKLYLRDLVDQAHRNVERERRGTLS